MLTKSEISKEGASVIEVMVAVSIFVILASTSVSVVLGSFLTSRLGEEESLATAYAEEGLNAVESIRNRSWEELADGVWGLSKSSGQWTFSGSQETLDGKYTRQIRVESVSRQDGSISETGGVSDPDTKKVVSKVEWAFTPLSSSNVEFSTYLTNWQTSFVPVLSPTPTPTSTPTPTPTPTPTSCSQVCINNGFSSGICRGNPGQCNSSGETNVSSGNQFCTGGAQADTCCCRP